MKIIAEVGSNWNDLEDLGKSVYMAKEDGADAVKFQYFTAKELYGFDVQSVDRYHVPLNVLQLLKATCNDAGIEFMCTAFSEQGYQQINHLVDTHKIASSESHDMRLVSCVLAHHKPTILSTGGLSFSRIARIIDMWNTMKHTELTLLYCDPTYPSHKWSGDILEGIMALQRYGVDVGLSDHSTSTKWSTEIMGRLYVIEKHYNPLGFDNTPDAGHSLGRDNFRELVKNLRNSPTFYTDNPHKRVKTPVGYYRPFTR